MTTTWRVPRATVYRRRARLDTVAVHAARRGPKTALTDAALLNATRGVLAASLSSSQWALSGACGGCVGRRTSTARACGTVTVRVTARGLYLVRSAANAWRARGAYVELTEVDGALRAAVFGLDAQVPRTTGPTLRSLEERFGIIYVWIALAIQSRDAAESLVTQPPNLG